MPTFVLVAPVSPLWERVHFEIEELAAAAVAAAAAELDEPLEWPAVIAFADDACVRDLNREHLGKDAPTNVLAFPAVQPLTPTDSIDDTPCLGDIVLAYETLVREAESARIPMADHVAHLIVHGFLHLQGYDHQTDDEAEVMENIERRALARLEIPDPYKVRADA